MANKIQRRKMTKTNTADALVQSAVNRFIDAAGMGEAYKAIVNEQVAWADDPHDLLDGQRWSGGDIPHSNGTERAVALARMVESLPPPAQSVVRMVLGSEIDVEGETVNKFAIQKTLRKCGWAYPAIWKAFDDIKQGLRDLESDFAL